MEQDILPCACGAAPEEEILAGTPFYCCPDLDCPYSSELLGRKAWNRHMDWSNYLRQRAIAAENADFSQRAAYQKARADKAEAEVARLREALDAVKAAISKCPNYLCEAVKMIRKALEGK